jgi:uncharacterized protein (UPF0332 family)
MPTEEQHLAQYERNVLISQHLAEASDYDWAVTALFYAALHLVQAWFVTRNFSVGNHRRRDNEMLASTYLQPILDEYRALRTHSENARYNCRLFSQREFEEIRSGSFATVVAHMESLGGTS